MKHSKVIGYGFGLRYKANGCPYIRIVINRELSDGRRQEAVYYNPSRSSQNRFTATMHALLLRDQAKKARSIYITDFRPEVYELWCRNMLQGGSM